MKKAAAILLAAVLLAGCSGRDKSIEQAMALRTKLLDRSCRFEAAIVADYGDKYHTFTLDCQSDSQGNVRFSVVKPDSIQGIEGSIDGKDGKLTFDDKVLYFPLLADDQVTPVDAPWILMKTLRSGYLTSAMQDGDTIRLTIDDSYDDDSLHLDIWLDSASIPTKAEILFRSRKILSMDIKGFRIE